MILAYRLLRTLDGLQTMTRHAIIKLPSHSKVKVRTQEDVVILMLVK